MYQAILFDLDGTLLDTLPDIFDSMNIFLERYNKPALSWEKMQYYISSGSASLIPFAFGQTMSDLELYQYRVEFLALHQQRGIIKTVAYPKVLAFIDYLQQQQIPWAVVTNKTESLAKQACQSFQGLRNYHCLVGAEPPQAPADGTPHIDKSHNTTALPLKPHPAPLLKACKQLHVDPEKCLMVGDTSHDADAAKTITMDCAIVNYGYHKPNQPPHQWHHHVIDSIDQCLQ